MMGDPSLVCTLDEALSVIGFGRFQSILLIYGGLARVAEAMQLMIVSFVGPAVRSEWNLSPTEESLISTAMFGGMLIGAYPWSFISDYCGRKKGFLGAVLVSAGAGFFCAFSPDYTSLVILRFTTGIGLGGSNIFTIWFIEFVPTSNRGAWMMIFTGFWMVGTIIEAVLAWIVMPTMGWRWLLALSAVPLFAVLFLYIFVPESPRFLCLKGQLSEALNILEQAARLNNSNLPNGMLLSDQRIESGEDLSSSAYTPMLKTRNQATESITGLSLFFQLFSSNLVRTTFLLWVLHFGIMFAQTGVVLLTSELSSIEKLCRPVDLLLEKIQDDSLYKDVFITTLADLPGLVVSAFIVDRIGRKLSMAIMFGLVFILLLPLVIYQSHIVAITLLFGVRMFVSAIFNILNIYAPEVYPTNIRTIGVGVAFAIGRVGAMISPLVAVGLLTSCHQTAATLLLAFVILLSGFSTVFIPLETKGRDLIDTM